MQIVKDDETSATEVLTYDPRKKYIWSKDANFSISGNEFGLLLNTLRAVISTEQAQIILRAAESAEVIEQMMAKGVAEGVITEHTEE